MNASEPASWVIPFSDLIFAKWGFNNVACIVVLFFFFYLRQQLNKTTFAKSLMWPNLVGFRAGDRQGQAQNRDSPGKVGG
jgi:hypothetical protein